MFNRRNALDASGGGDALASALRDLQQATKLGPEDADAWAYLARAESAKGDHLAAVASNEKALALGVAEAEAVKANLERAKQRAQAASLASAGGAAERLSLLRESVAADPMDLESLLQCGEALLELGEEEVAEASGCAEKAQARKFTHNLPLLVISRVILTDCLWLQWRERRRMADRCCCWLRYAASGRTGRVRRSTTRKPRRSRHLVPVSSS